MMWIICSGLLPDHCCHTSDLLVDAADDVNNIHCTTMFKKMKNVVITTNTSMREKALVELPRNLADWLSRIADKLRFLRYTHIAIDRNINKQNKTIAV
jgi:hypothetical protein